MAPGPSTALRPPYHLRSAQDDSRKKCFPAMKIPRHIAIIMDGNGRWAKERGLPRIKGHEQGAAALRQVVEGCAELEVEFLTVYAFSTENWSRPKTEVAALMKLLEHFIAKETPELIEKGIRL